MFWYKVAAWNNGLMIPMIDVEAQLPISVVLGETAKRDGWMYLMITMIQLFCQCFHFWFNHEPALQYDLKLWEINQVICHNPHLIPTRHADFSGSCFDIPYLGGDCSRWLISIAKLDILNLTVKCLFHEVCMSYFTKGDPLNSQLPKNAQQVLRKTLVYDAWRTSIWTAHSVGVWAFYGLSSPFSYPLCSFHSFHSYLQDHFHANTMTLDPRWLEWNVTFIPTSITALL